MTEPLRLAPVAASGEVDCCVCSSADARFAGGTSPAPVHSRVGRQQTQTTNIAVTVRKVQCRRGVVPQFNSTCGFDVTVSLDLLLRAAFSVLEGRRRFGSTETHSAGIRAQPMTTAISASPAHNDGQTPGPSRRQSEFHRSWLSDRSLPRRLNSATSRESTPALR